MNNKSFDFIGWMKEGIHDKVWVTYVIKDDFIMVKYITIWGRRGRKLQYKSFEDYRYEYDKLVRSKLSKGYMKINKTRLDEVYPEFQQDLEAIAIWSTLIGV